MSQTVLIADDSIPQHALVKAHLEKDALTFHSVYDGETALTIAASLHPDLILLDIDMPRLDGFEVCKRLKENPLTGTIPVIFLTADAVLMDKVKGLDLGAVDYINKPYKPEELRARVRSALRCIHVLDHTRMVDTLTGLWNQRYFELQLKSQLSLARRSHRTLACIAADVDHLGMFNARFGQSTGDELLRNIARIFLGQCRAEDLVCHLAAGKFAMLVGDANRRSATPLAERLRREIERQSQSRAPAEAAVTCSFGLSDTAVSPEEALFQQAETALRRSKHIGRNCVTVARESTATAA